MARNHVASIDTLPREQESATATKNARVKGDGRGHFWVSEFANADGFAVLSDLASTANAKGASLVGIEDAATDYTATTVEGALAEVKVIADATAAVKLQKKEQTFTAAQLAALGAVVTGTFGVQTALPADAQFAGARVVVGTKFQNVGDTDVTTCDVGTSAGGHADIGVDGASLKTTGTKFGGTNAAPFGGYSVSGEQATITFNSSVNFDTLTAGECTVTLFYFVLA